MINFLRDAAASAIRIVSVFLIAMYPTAAHYDMSWVALGFIDGDAFDNFLAQVTNLFGHCFAHVAVRQRLCCIFVGVRILER